MPLKNKQNELILVDVIAEILRKKGLWDSDFNVPRSKVMARQAIKLKRVEEQLPWASDIVKANDIELQEIMENVENLIAQFEGETLPMHKQLRSIRGSLKVETVRKVTAMH